jgi:hypothetical protein
MNVIKKEILFLSKDRILIKYRNEVYEFKITLEKSVIIEVSPYELTAKDKTNDYVIIYAPMDMFIKVWVKLYSAEFKNNSSIIKDLISTVGEYIKYFYPTVNVAPIFVKLFELYARSFDSKTNEEIKNFIDIYSLKKYKKIHKPIHYKHKLRKYRVFN